MMHLRKPISAMKIFFANKRPPYPFIIGGDAVNIHAYLSYFQSKGHTCYWLGTFAPKAGYEMPSPLMQTYFLLSHGYAPKFHLPSVNPHSLTLSFYSSYNCSVVDSSYFQQALFKALDTISPDIVITQLDGSEIVISAANARSIPSLLCITDAEQESLQKIVSKKSAQPSGIICVSHFVRKQIPVTINTPCTVFPPPIISSDYLTKKDNRQYITCINPVRLKGGEVLEKIIEAFPNQEFLIVKGWYDPIHDGFNFKKYRNVTIIKKQYSMKKIYAKTKILLIPSLWNEAIPRVAIEASLNGIPVIASDKGGISEALGKSGIYIHSPNSIPSWKKAISELLSNKKRYATLSRLAKSQAKKFDVNAVAPSLLRWGTNVAKVADLK